MSESSRIYPSECDDADVAYLESFSTERIPADAMVTGLITMMSWIEPETGALRWDWFIRGDQPTSTVIGIIELAKLSIIKRGTSGIFPPLDDDS